MDSNHDSVGQSHAKPKLADFEKNQSTAEVAPNIIKNNKKNE